MTNNKLVSIGGGALLVLAALYLGNLVVRTTPGSSAFGTSQYKVVNAVSNCSNASCVEKLLNDTAKDGWELTATDNEFLIFRK